MANLKVTKKILLGVMALAAILTFLLSTSLTASAAIPSCEKMFETQGAGNPRLSVKCLLDIVAQEAGYPVTDDPTFGKPEQIASLLGSLFTYILGFLGVLFTILIIYAGILWMTARGNEEQVKKARTILKDAVIGLFIVLASAVIMYVIVNLLLPAAPATPPPTS